jgi:hypothetical protein
MIRFIPAAVACCVVLLFVVACSSEKKPTNELTKEEEAIVHVGLAYREASTALKRPPSKVEEIKPYLAKYGEPDQVLLSPNDGQPYQINWGVTPMRPSDRVRTRPLIAYEQSGKSGKRCALDFMLRVHHLTDDELARFQGSN